MSINEVDIYDFGAWIDLAPDYDWGLLAAAPEPEEPSEPEEPAAGE